MENGSSNEILIAIIGVFGVLFTAILSNWDKIFPRKDVVKATFRDYRPTNDFETELRYYLDVSATRKSFEILTQKMTAAQKEAALKAHPGEANEIAAISEIILEESIKFDDLIEAVLPIYRKHFSIEELQELNKFYSTEVMQHMTKKMPLVISEVAPLHLELMNRYEARIDEKIDQVMNRN
ncbi:DUF2059 domain-containing protein [Oricola sp.]|uniref:DUF2059 domain-containing protein n=1 Tax=Oricola sp. TaxID=1979950 RepID=UPI003BAC762D